MAEGNEDRAVVIVERSNGLGTFFFGLALGAGMALLLAPHSGEETRRLLQDRARRAREVAEDKLDELQDVVEDGYERTKASIEEGLASARKRMSDKREGARHAVDAGRAAVRSARDELERRLAESRADRTPAPDEDEA